MFQIQMQRGGAARATAPLQTNTGVADRLSVAAPGRCPVQRARQEAPRRTACVNAGLYGPGVVTRTGAGMLLLHLPARGMGGVSGKPPPTTPRSDNTTEGTQRGGGAATTAQSRGCGGSAASPASNNIRGLPHNTTSNQHAQRPRSKRRRGGASPAPFCCPPPAGDRGRTFQQRRSDKAAGARAQDITGVMRGREGCGVSRCGFA